MASEDKIQEAIAEANFNLLKLQLHNYIKSNFRVCDSFLKQLGECKNEKSLTNLFEKYKNDVYSRLGGEPELEDEVANLERKVERLENDIESLEVELGEAKVTYGNTLDDEFKRQFIQEFYNNFTPWELEELLKNGKKYLQS